MKITGLQAKDFLVIQELDIKPTGRLSIFAGKNKAGKSSILKAIKALFKGSTDTSLIRTGADKAEIVADIDGIMKIRRTIRKSGTQSLDIQRSDGLKPAKPQTYLDGLIGNFTFDPIAFLLDDEDKRKQYLLDLCAIKITADDLKDVVDPEILKVLDFNKDFLSVLKDAETLYSLKRRDINKKVAELKTLHEDGMRAILGFDPEKKPDGTLEDANIRIREKERELAEAELLQRQADERRQQVNDAMAWVKEACETLETIDDQLIGRIPEMRSRIADIQGKIELLQEEKATIEGFLSAAILEAEKEQELKEGIAQRAELLKALEINVPDIEPLKSSLAMLNGLATAYVVYDRQLNAYKAAMQHKEEHDRKKTESDGLTTIIEKLRTDIPEKLAKKSGAPIQGLRFEGDKVFVGDKAIDNMSTSEQIDFAISVVEMLNKDYQLKVMCLDRAESLDDETLKEFAAKVPEDWQFFLSFVQRGDSAPEGAYIVENGSIKQENLL